MKNPRVLIFAGYGFNCEDEVKVAYTLAGAEADIVHLNDVIANPRMIAKYQMITFPGGFSYGDDTGSGNAYAQKVRNHLWDHMMTFIAGDHLVIGICNGFQVLVNTGLLPGVRTYGTRDVALLANESARYMVRWTDVQANSPSPWLRNIDTMMLPIAHGEGRMYMAPSTLARMKKQKQIALSYIKGEICTYQSLPANPTGTIENITGITDPTGKILGMMPHPERAIFFTQLPHWTYVKEQLERAGKPIPTEGPGLQLFKNAVSYFT